jgi:hypothetical protein
MPLCRQSVQEVEQILLYIGVPKDSLFHYFSQFLDLRPDDSAQIPSLFANPDSGAHLSTSIMH